MRRTRIAPIFWLVALVTLAIDWATKYAAYATLAPYAPHRVIRDVVRLTLAYDLRRTFWLGVPGTPYIPVPGGAPVFFAVKFLLLGVMVWLASRSPRRLVPAVGVLFGAGAANTIEQVMTGSVINFLDVGAGSHRWPTFNVADAALVSTGLVLAILLQREAVRERGWRRSLLSMDFSLPRSLRRDQDDRR